MKSPRVPKIRPYVPIRLVGVLNHGQPHGAVPTWFITREEARYLWTVGFATWRGDWLLVLKKTLPLQLRGPSANIRESTIIEAISGSRYHQSLIESWS